LVTALAFRFQNLERFAVAYLVNVFTHPESESLADVAGGVSRPRLDLLLQHTTGGDPPSGIDCDMKAPIELTPEQALEVLRQIAHRVPLTFEQNELLRRALATLEKFLHP